MKAELVCPECQGGIKFEAENLLSVCMKCSRSWGFKQGIPSFAEQEYYWNQIEKSEMNQLLQVANEKGYQEALETCLLPKTNEHTYGYALNESRGDFRFLLSHDRKSRVLDIGCGWGSVTSSLARTFGEVVAADTNIDTLQFLRIRARQEQLSNIDLVHIEPLDKAALPFSDGYFDVVVLNGVLEWTGMAVNDKSPDAYQTDALREIKRILNKGGKLYIGIENRIGFQYFLGARDEHSETRFTNLMPRRIADLYMRLKNKGGYRTYTYTMFGYQALLSRAGYGRIQFYLPVRTYRDPEYIIPLQDQGIVNYYLKNCIPRRSFKHQVVYVMTRVLSVLGLFKYFVPGYSIVAEPT